ncbi:hypothetical protein C4K88_05655 [Arthrobacter pityocampae]|uniref:Uncharacterized protein n=1 Tax=Arthrobacter pityocampae TaxID=547334 RepID=A0A2S5J079_9MICC|nr:hypothetical protein C4K88_05655 [Arthrobacter pityocampae]
MEPLIPADVVVVGTSTIVPDATRPVAAIVGQDSSVRWVVWPEADMPERSVERPRVWPTPNGAWLIYETEDTEDPTDLAERSTVFIARDGRVANFALRAGWPVGADDDGLWIGDPRTASEWMGAPDAPGRAQDDLGAAGVHPERLDWMPPEPFWPGEPPQEPDVSPHTSEIEMQARHGDDTERPITGLTGARTHYADRAGNGDAAPGAPLSTPETELVWLQTDGSRALILVDHLVHQVRLKGTQLTVQYYPTGPHQVFDQHHRNWNLAYEAREITVDVKDGLPDRIDTDLLPSRAVPTEANDYAAEDADDERHRRAVASWSNRLDLAGVEGTRWPLVESSDAARELAVTHLRVRFEGLDAPLVIWTSDHPGYRRAHSEYRNVEITVQGEWPATVVVVSFEHHIVPHARLRRRYRVFDDAGRPRTWAYATVHLDEDLYTGAFPPRSAAINGVLDI